MIRVIKKSGRIENFEADKIITSIQNAASDLGQLMSQKDASLITGDVRNELIRMRGLEALTSSYELRAMIWQKLRDFGYHAVADSYMQ